MEEIPGSIVVAAAPGPVLRYHTATVEPPAGLPGYYRRSGFIHPLYSPAGHVLTDDFPVGHVHQHGIFYAFVNTRFRGQEIDFWNQQDQTGTVVHRHLTHQPGPGDALHLDMHLLHLAFPAPQDSVPVLQERWSLVVYPPSWAHVIDLRAVQHCIADSALHILTYHYGGLGVRGSACWNSADTLRFEGAASFCTSAGDTRETGNHSRPAWTALYGPIEGDTAGIAVISHPANRHYPDPVRLHPEMPYFALAPMALQGWTMQPGDSLVSHYRVVTFDGGCPAAWLDSLAADFARTMTPMAD